jgi:hypothetical protein
MDMSTRSIAWLLIEEAGMRKDLFTCLRTQSPGIIVEAIVLAGILCAQRRRTAPIGRIHNDWVLEYRNQ